MKFALLAIWDGTQELDDHQQRDGKNAMSVLNYKVAHAGQRMKVYPHQNVMDGRSEFGNSIIQVST